MKEEAEQELVKWVVKLDSQQHRGLITKDEFRMKMIEVAATYVARVTKL